MSTIAAATDVGTIDQALAGATLVQQTIAQLTQEVSTGYTASDFAAVGSGAATAIDLSTQLNAQTAAQSTAATAANIQNVAQTALGQIESIASSFASSATSLETLPDTIGTVAAQAQSALTQVANLLNTQVGDVYVFAGQDSTNPPVPSPNQIGQSAFYTAIQSAIAGLTANGAAATAAQTLNIASPGGTTPFSATLEASSLQSQVTLGNGVQVALAPLANQNSNATSSGAGTTSTGSYTRDILRGLATLANLTSAQSGDPNFLPLVQNTVTSLQGAVSAINTDIGALGDRQDQVSAAQTELTDTSTALKTQLGNVQDANLAQVSAQLSQAQTQLQASFQIIASLKGLSLAQYL